LFAIILDFLFIAQLSAAKLRILSHILKFISDFFRLLGKFH